jgi:hypothetical protein
MVRGRKGRRDESRAGKGGRGGKGRGGEGKGGEGRGGEETEVWEGRERGMYASIHQGGIRGAGRQYILHQADCVAV